MVMEITMNCPAYNSSHGKNRISFRIIICLVFMVSLWTSISAEAGRPEFDAVGCDAANYFNDSATDIIIENNLDKNKIKVNEYSAFANEFFIQTAGQSKFDPCFPQYKSHLTEAWSGARFAWQIVLQAKPETDLDIDIRDCVLMCGSSTPFGSKPFEGALQTGRYVMPWGQIFYFAGSNPMISVTAYPGPFATHGFPADGFNLDARTTPGARLVSLNGRKFTSIGLWGKSIVVAMPETGTLNMYGQTQYRLKPGDILKIVITVPESNTLDMRYGPDNVTVRYVGIYGTEFLTDQYCSCGN